MLLGGKRKGKRGEGKISFADKSEKASTVVGKEADRIRMCHLTGKEKIF